MTLKEKKLAYAKAFINQLLTSCNEDDVDDVDDDDDDDAEDEATSIANEDPDDVQLKHVLENALTQSLVDLEKRYSLYWEKLGHERDVNKIQNTISRLEKRLIVFSQETQRGNKLSEVPHAHRQAMKNCYSQLKRDLFPLNLMNDLFQSDILSMSDQESIGGLLTRGRQNEDLLTLLIGRLTQKEFNTIFLPALNKEHKHLADLLIMELDQVEEEFQESQCVACRTRQHVQLKRLAAPLLRQGIISLVEFMDLRNPGMSNNSKWTELRQVACDAAIISALEKKYPDFYQEFLQQDLKSLECRCPAQEAVDPDLERVPTNSCSCSGVETRALNEEMDITEDENLLMFQSQDVEQEYPMKANPRGICLIINTYKFTDGPRSGFSQVNVERLRNTFKRLQFRVITKEKFSSGEMKATLKSCSEDDHSKYDAFVCAIISRGDEDGLFGSDGDHVTVAELYSFFTASRCPSLAGKPKIFLIEASRGSNYKSYETEDEQKIADEADFVVGYSCPPGCKSVKRMGKESVFIGALTDILDNHADQKDFLTCLTMTNEKVSKKPRKTLTKIIKQVPAPVFTLTKTLHLTSDPLWPHLEDVDGD